MGTTIKELKQKKNGNVILPDDKNYEEARKLYNAMIDKHPKIIFKCCNTDDVIQAVNFGRENNLETAIRSGGHSGPGLASVNDGLVIDLSEMKDIRIDSRARTARIQPGCTWGEVDKATHEHGLATVSGIISTTGVGGLTLGGGHGYLTHQYGLTIDNLLEADVVLADGSLFTTNEEQHADLFWALRGGGGNFGVVTSFTFRLHPVDNVIAGPMFWPLEQTETTLKWYREWQPKTLEENGSFYLVGEVPSADPFPKEIWGKKVCGVMWFFNGPEADFKHLIQEARNVAQPLFEFTGPMPYPAVQSIFDGLFPTGLQWYWKGDFVHDISEAAVQEHLRFSEVPTSRSAMHLYSINGAVHRVGKKDRAWNMRDANWSMVIVAADPDPKNNDRMKEWARDYQQALHPYNKNGAYINFMMEEGDDRIRATYGDNYEQLQKVKAKYDPKNFFHINQNIKPAKL